MLNNIISVIVPVYNTEPFLKRCLDSISAQDSDDIEIIIVDDGSTDNSSEIYAEYVKKDKRFRVIKQKNMGLSEARNSGIRESNGFYVTFIDSDDYIEPDYCSGLKELLEKNDADISCGAIRDVFKENEIFVNNENREYVFSAAEALKEMFKGKIINGSSTCKLYKKSLFEGKRFPKGMTYEDAYLLPDLFLGAEKVAVTDKTFYTYWHHEGSITTRPYSERVLDAITAYERTMNTVKEQCPECIPEASFRLYWAYFVVLDRMLSSANYKELPEYGRVVKFLKSHTKEITSCPYFEKTRRIGARALKIGVPFYKILLKFHMKRIESNE